MRQTSTIVIPFRFAEKVCEKGLQKPFAVWLKLKQLYVRHTIIYNISYPKLSKQTNICIPTLKKYVRRIIDLGWAEERDGHLVLKSFKKVTGKTSVRSGLPIQIRDWMTFQYVVRRVSSLVIINDYQKQAFRIGLDSGRIQAHVRAQKKLLKKYGYRAGKEDKLILTSCQRVSKQTNMSPSSAWRLMKRLTKDKILKLKPRVERLTKAEYPEEQFGFYDSVHKTKRGYVYINGTYAYINRGTEICRSINCA